MRDIRFPAEWESCEAILVALPNASTDWEYMLKEVRSCYHSMIEAFVGAGENVVVLAADKEEAMAALADIPAQERIRILSMDFNDTWTRDYGPITVERNGRTRALDFGFNGWGLKFAADKDNLVNLCLNDRCFFAPGTYRNERDFILEGGSLETDGRGTLLTTSRCLCSENRNGGKSKEKLTEILHDRLGVDHVLWLDYGYLAGDDTDSHIDTLARMCPNDTITFVGCRDMDDEHFEELLRMRAQLSLFRTPDGSPYNLVELPLPSPVYDEQGERLPATYANYLVTPRNLFMPIYGQSANDELAINTIRIPFPEKKIVPVDCSALIKQHGSLHCATMQLPANLFISS